MYLSFMDYRHCFSYDDSLSLVKHMSYSDTDLEKLKIYNWRGKYMP